MQPPAALIPDEVPSGPKHSQQKEPSIYTSTFWWAYVANLLLISANALTFRFADLVNLLGGTEQLAGTIVSVGSIGALFGRFFLGQWIDRYGVRPVWLICTLMYLVGIALMIVVPSLGWTMYAGRTLFALGIGGMISSSMTHIQNLVPAYRRTEIIATLGSSGFLGIIVGSQLSDLISRFTPDTLLRHQAFFGTTALLGAIYLVIVFGITRNEPRQKQIDSPPAWPLLRRYWPGWVMVMGMAIGMAFTCSSVFIARYATELNLRGVGTYFTAYAITAFIVRILTRHTSKIYGRHRMIVVGMLGHIVGYAALCFVTAEWHFLFPAICSGYAHALLFPCVVSLGTARFPQQYRGTGTTLVLCFFDLGGVVTAPVLGAVIDHIGFHAMFMSTSVACVVLTILYAYVVRAEVDPEMLGVDKPADPSREEKTGMNLADNRPEELVAPARPCESGCAS